VLNVTRPAIRCGATVGKYFKSTSVASTQAEACAISMYLRRITSFQSECIRSIVSATTAIIPVPSNGSLAASKAKYRSSPISCSVRNTRLLSAVKMRDAIMMIDVSAEEQKPSTNRQVFQSYGYDRQNKNKRENQSLRIVKWWHHSCGPSRHRVQMTLTVGTPKTKVNIGAR
jgi:hypothetical protein